jgi:DNA polymerase III epsilon subunit-like protein
MSTASEQKEAAIEPQSRGKREIVLDIKTTGAYPHAGHRIVEVGCVELVNRIPTGHTFHAYCNPERGMPAEAFAVHGLSEQFLKDKPFFVETADDLIAFLGDAPLVGNNTVSFDLGFLNAELERAGRPPLSRERFVAKRLDGSTQPGGYADARRSQFPPGFWEAYRTFTQKITSLETYDEEIPF